MENLFWAFMALQWWQHMALFVIIYFILGLYGAVMYFAGSRKYHDEFWIVVLFWWMGIKFQLTDAVGPYYRKCKKERVKKRIYAKIKKYGLPELKTD